MLNLKFAKNINDKSFYKEQNSITESIILQIKNFQNTQSLLTSLNDAQKKAADKKMFLELSEEFDSLLSKLRYCDDENIFGDRRIDYHTPDYTTFNNYQQDILKMIHNETFHDLEFVESCIEELKTEIEILEDKSFGEIIEDNLY